MAADEASSGVLKFTSAKELCAGISRPKWIIKDIIDVNSLSCIFGAPGSMKSFLAIDMGLCIASDKAWHGHDTERSGPVFYICGEGYNGIRKRVNAWREYNEVGLDEVPFYASNTSIQILENDSIGKLNGAIEGLVSEHGNPSLIIVDTLNRNFGDGDENSTGDMTRFVAKLDLIKNRYGCAVLIIHHTGLKDAKRARGASALQAALDWEYLVKKDKTGTVTLTCTKSKDFDEPEPMSFKPQTVMFKIPEKLDSGELGGMIEMDSCVLVATEYKQPPSKPVKLSGANLTAYNSLKGLYKGSSVPVGEWKKKAIDDGISGTNTPPANDKAFARALKKLTSEPHWVITDDDGLTYRPNSEPVPYDDEPDNQDGPD